MEFKKALVTGGAGFIGSHLAEALLTEGLEVRILDDLSVGLEANVPEGTEFLLGDVRDIGAVRDALDGIDIVFHLAAKVSIRGSIEKFREDADVNLMGTVNVLEAAHLAGAKKIILASSMAVYADSAEPIPIDESHDKAPISPYGVAKLAAERYCLLLGETSGIETCALRYFNTYGPRQGFTPYVGVITIFINRLLAGESPVIFGDGEQRRDFVYVGDIVKANILAMKAHCPGEIFNVGTGKATSVNEIAALLCAKISPGIEAVYSGEQAGELKNSIAGISRAGRVIGYAPDGILEDRIEEVIAWNRELEGER